jgi:hypothetical protein
MSGELVKAGWARNQSEAEMIQGMLMEQGIPSVLRRTRGFDVPDFLAAGPRDVMVEPSELERARALLAGPEGPEPIDPHADEGRTRRLVVGLAIALVLAVAITYGLYVLIV